MCRFRVDQSSEMLSMFRFVVLSKTLTLSLLVLGCLMLSRGYTDVKGIHTACLVWVLTQCHIFRNPLFLLPTNCTCTHSYAYQYPTLLPVLFPDTSLFNFHSFVIIIVSADEFAHE